jgi:hypothetical protein
MVNYYHKFVPHLTDMATPLNTVCKKGVQFVWGEEQQEAFEKLKRATSQPPVFGHGKFQG